MTRRGEPRARPSPDQPEADPEVQEPAWPRGPDAEVDLDLTTERRRGIFGLVSVRVLLVEIVR